MAAPTADEFFGPSKTLAPPNAPTPAQLPTSDEFFGARRPADLSFAQSYGLAEGGAPPLAGDDADAYFAKGSPGAVLSAFGQGIKDGWGAAPLGLDKDTEAALRKAGIFNDYQSGHTSLWKSFNEELMRPAAAAADLMFNRFPNALYHGAAEVALMAGVPRDIVAMPEAFPAGPFTGLPTRIAPLARAEDLGVVGKGEAGYQGLPTPEEVAAPREAGAAPVAMPTPAPEPELAPGGAIANAAAEGPDLHAIARQIAPDVFAEYDDLAQRRDTLRTTLADLGEMRDRGTSPAIQALDTQIDDLRGQRLEALTAERPAMADQIAALEEQRAKLADALPETGDTSEMAALRQDMLEADYRMRDIAATGALKEAYRQAAEGMPKVIAEPEAEVPAAAAPTEAEAAEPAPVATPEPAAEQAASAPAEAPAAQPIPGGIAGDVAKQLVAAGRPAEEADAAGALVQAHYEARAANLNGATPEGLYSEEAPRVVASRGARQQPAMELAQSGELEQPRRGKIRLADPETQARATITLFKDADASTFIHETGHAWLEELMRDAGDSRATDAIRADAATVHDWLGTQAGTEIPTRAHEKFARGFERYMMEGHAPSAPLASVFAKFKQWLTTIYQTVSALRSPINADIRGVFDRMLATPEERIVIAPGEPTGTFADLHEADAVTTLPERAGEVAPIVRDERDRVMEAAAPEVQDERVAGRAPAADGGSAEGGGLPAPEIARARPAARSSNGLPERGAVSEGRGNAAPEGNRAPTKPSEVPAAPNASFGPADERLIDRAGNIRLDNLNQPDDIEQAIRDAADRNGGFVAERRGVITDGQLLDLADAVGKDPAFLDRKKIGDAFAPEEILAARKLLVQSATAVRDAMARAAGGDEVDIAALAQTLARHEMIQGKVAQATAEWGRAGRAFRALDGWQQARDLNQFLKENTGRDLNQLRQMAQLGPQLTTPGQISKFVADTSGGKIKQAIIYYWTNALLSGPVTHLTYSIGNGLNALWTPLVETPLAAASGSAREVLGLSVPERRYLRESSAQLYGLAKGFRDALPAAQKAWKYGVSPLLAGEKAPRIMLDASLNQPIPGGVGYALGLPSRAVSAIHTFFRTIRYEQNIQALAVRTALDEGLAGPALETRIAKLAESPTPEMMESAVADTLKELYMRPQDYNSAGAALARATNNFLPAKIVAPFVRVGSEIVRNAFIERTPLGLLNQDVRNNLLMRNGGAAFDTQLGKVMAGTGLIGAAMLGVLEGNITGDGPADPDERRVWLLTHQPTHVAVGPLTFSYARLGHLGMLMRFAANMTETARRWDDQDGPKLAAGFFTAITRSVLDETWMRGVKDFFDAVYQPEENFDRWVTGFVAQWTPFSIGMGQIARVADPYQRETRDLTTLQEIFNQVKAHTPLWSQTLPARYDVFGEPISNGAGTVDRYANDHVAQAMDTLHIGLKPVERKIRGVLLTPTQYADFARMSGKMAKMELDGIVGPGFEAMPAEARIKVIKETVSHAREAVAAQIMAQSMGTTNDIVGQAMSAKLQALKK